MRASWLQLLGCGIVLITAAVRADDEAPETPAATNAAVADVDDSALRDPFWPPGYVPPSAIPTVATTNQTATPPPPPPPPKQAEWPDLDLKGLIRNPKGDYLAQIDGVGIAEKGQTVTLKKNGMVFRWKINDITEKGLSFTRLDIRPGR